MRTRITYRGVTAQRTIITTGDGRNLRQLWRLEGRIVKPAEHRPFLTSQKECRDYVREYDDDRALAAEIREQMGLTA